MYKKYTKVSKSAKTLGKQQRGGLKIIKAVKQPIAEEDLQFSDSDEQYTPEQIQALLDLEREEANDDDDNASEGSWFSEDEEPEPIPEPLKKTTTKSTQVQVVNEALPVKKIKIIRKAEVEKITPPKPVEYYSWVEDGEYTNTANKKWLLPNNNKYPNWVLDNYSQYRLPEASQRSCDASKNAQPSFQYQDFIKEYMSYQSPYRGVLLYYGLGAGKTRAALEIARTYKTVLGWDVIFISPAGLVDNFVEEMAKWNFITQAIANNIIGAKSRKSRVNQMAEQGFHIVSYNASNKNKQLKDALQIGGPGTKARLRNKVIIVDEVHNMAQFIHNGLNQKDPKKWARAKEFYDILYSATNCRFVFLSGTPMINTPSELAIMFNLLRGPMRYRSSDNMSNLAIPSAVKSKTDFYPVFPLGMEQFDDLFIDWETLSLKPGMDEVFKHRIMGLVSYYSGAQGDVYPDIVDAKGAIRSKGDTPWTVVLVPMSPYQFYEYEEIRQIEREEISKNKKLSKKVKNPLDAEIMGALKSTENTIDSTFRIKSRQISNFALSPELSELRPSSISKDPELLTELYSEFERLAQRLDEEGGENIFDAENLEKYSPKMLAMLEQIDSIRGTDQDGGVLVYSNFRSIEGIELFSRVLEANGYEWYDPSLGMTEPDPDVPKFAILGTDYRTGEDNTTELVRIFNSPENVNGDIIKVLLGTSSISEGLSLFNIRLVLIMEPHWNMVRINQVIGRARRICSHSRLPKNKWNFQVYMYLTVIPMDDEKIAQIAKDDPLSTDEVLYDIATKKERVKSQFVHLIKEAAIDCMLNATHNKNLAQDPPVRCLTSPQYKEDKLTYSYYPDISDDMASRGISPPNKGKAVKVAKGAKTIPKVVQPQPSMVKKETEWAPFIAINHSKFINKETNKPIYGIAIDPKTNKCQTTLIKFKNDPKEYGACALYDLVQLEHAGNFVLKTYIVQGKSPLPLVKPEDVIILK